MAAQPMPTAQPCDPTVSRRIDYIIIHLEASDEKSIRRAWWRLQKRIAERQIPGRLPEGGRP